MRTAAITIAAVFSITVHGLGRSLGLGGEYPSVMPPLSDEALRIRRSWSSSDVVAKLMPDIAREVLQTGASSEKHGREELDDERAAPPLSELTPALAARRTPFSLGRW
jgi:hypothetical protein